MNKTFNKLFRKSVSLNANDQQQLNNQVSQANYSPPPTHNSGGGLQHSTSSPNATLSQQQQGHIGGSNSNSSGSLSSSSSIALSSSKSFNGVPSQLSSSSSSPNSSQLHLNKEIQHNYQTLPLIDYEYILNSYIKEGDSLKSYFLIHSILSKKGPSSSGNLKEHQHTSKSWQPFFKKNSYPCFLAICQRNLLILDATNQPFSLTRRIPLIDLKEIIFDSTDLGIFSIETHINQQQRIDFNNNLLFFSIGCEKKEISDLILNSLEEALRESSIFNKGNSIIKKIKMVGERDQNQKKDFKDHVNELLDDMSILGFTAQDLWEGNTDLKFWVDKIRDKIILNPDDRFVVEFILPDLGNNNDRKKIFRVPNNISITDITHFLASRLGIPDYSIYTLSTIKGTELAEKDLLSDYGLGSFFDNWQLCLIEKGKTRKAGLFNLEVHFPDGNEFVGRHHRILELDGYMSCKKIVKFVSDQMDVPKGHLYTLRIDIPATNNTEINKSNSSNVILEDNDYLASFGLGTRFNKCKLKLVLKKFPKASKDSMVNQQVIKSILQDIVDLSWYEYQERKQYKSALICKEIINEIIESVCQESLRASTLAVRIASLSSASRVAIYKFLAQKEQDEINYYKMPGQKKIANEAKDMVANLTPILGPSMETNLDEEDNTMKIRVPPPPPPPILGFKNFKPKKEVTVTTTVGQTKTVTVQYGNPSIQNVDMNAVLSMRGKLRATTKKEDEASAQQPQPDKSKINFTLRQTKVAAKPIQSTQSTAETNELMMKLQKRNANINLTEAEELC